MKGRAVSLMYGLNIVMQAIFTLLMSVGVFVGIAYLLSAKAGVGEWVYIPAVIVGLAIGVVSMMKFIYCAMLGLERLERQRDSNNEKNEREGGDVIGED